LAEAKAAHGFTLHRLRPGNAGIQYILKEEIVSVTKEITRLDKSNVKLSLTVPKEDVLSQYQDIIKEYCKNVQIPGFRKGKVPQAVLERKFGSELQGEALGKIIEKTMEEVFEDESMPENEKPYSSPEMEEEPALDFGKDLCFSLVYDVFPTVEVGQWKGFEVEVPDAAVSKEDIARELEDVRERSALVIDRDENAQAQNGDVVTINYCELGENDEAIPSTERQDFACTLGKNLNIYAFDEDMVGMKKGETKTFSKTYPEGEKEAFAGQTKKFKVTLTALKEKKLPDLDDELAQDVDEKYKTLDDLKNSIQERLQKNLDMRLREMKVNKLLEKIMESTPVILPESMVKAELNGRMRSFARNLGIETAKLTQMMGESNEFSELSTAWRPSAEKSLHSKLIINAIIDKEKVEPSADDIEKELESMASDEGTSIEELKAQYGEGRIMEILKDELQERKLFDMLLTENTVAKGPAARYLDVMGNNG
jgi:trigger factor